MNTQITFEIPEYVSDDEFEEYFRENLEELYPAMDLHLSDDRAQVDDVTITELDISEESVFIEYEIEFSAYYGCRDANYADTDQRTLTGKRKGRSFIFDVFVPPPHRSTHEEF